MVIPPESLPLAALSGACFALIGVAYRYGEDHDTQPHHILLVCAIVGAGLFGAMSLDQWDSAPSRMWLWGLGAGLSQYALVKLLGVGLRMGPLSPLWCALMLAFVPVILFAAVAHGEPLGRMDLLAVLAAGACVVTGSFKKQVEVSQAARGPAGARRWLYGLVLLGAMLLNSVANVAMKVLNHGDEAGGSNVALYGNVFRASLYAGLGLAIVSEMLLRRRFGAPLGWTLGLGTVAACGSVAGLWALSVAAAGPAAMVFPLSNAVSIVVASVASVTLFPEKADRIWLATVGLGVLAAALATWPALAWMLGG